MTSRIKTIADLVTTRLAAGSYGEAFTPATKLFPRFDDSETGTLDVFVISGPQVRIKQNRQALGLRVQNIPVVVRAKISGDYDAIETRVDELFEVCDNIEDDLVANRLGDWRPTEFVQSVPFDFESLLEKGIFQSIMTIKYKGFV